MTVLTSEIAQAVAACMILFLKITRPPWIGCSI